MTKAEAKYDVQQLRSKAASRSEFRLRVYKCNLCEHYHVGSAVADRETCRQQAAKKYGPELL